MIKSKLQVDHRITKKFRGKGRYPKGVLQPVVQLNRGATVLRTSAPMEGRRSGKWIRIIAVVSPCFCHEQI